MLANPTSGTLSTGCYESTFSQPTSFTDARGSQAIYTVDSSTGNTTQIRQVVGQVDGVGNTETNDVVTGMTYTGTGTGPLAGSVSTITDPLGRVTAVDYVYSSTTNPHYLPSKIRFAVGTADAADIELQYNASDEVVAEFDELDRRTDYVYNNVGLLLSKTLPDPDGAGQLARPVYTWEYSAGYKPSKEIDPLGRETLFEYTPRFDLKKITRPDHDGDGNLSITTYTYDLHRRLTQETDELGRVTVHGYDSLDRETSTTLPDSDGAGPLAAPIYVHAFDAIHRPTQETDPLSNGSRVDYAYVNTLGQPTLRARLQLSDPNSSGFLSSYDQIDNYDAEGNLVQQIDARDLAATVLRDELGRPYNINLSHATISGSMATIISHDKASNVTSVRDPNGFFTTYTYDNRDRVKTITREDPDGTDPQTAPVTTFAYDAAGQVTSITDPLGRVTSYQYDGLGRQIVTTQQDPDGTGPLAAPVTQMAYDAASQLTSTTNPLGGVTTYEYDLLGNLKKVTEPDPDSTAPLAAPVTQFAHNAASELTSVTDAGSRQTSYQYDGLGRITHVTQPDPDGAEPLTAPVTTSAYDAVGNLTSETDPLLNVTSYLHDNRYRVKRVTQEDPDGGGSLASPQTNFTYSLANDLLTVSDPLSRVTTHVYDVQGRLTSTTQPDPDAGGSLLSPVTTFAYMHFGDHLTSATDPLSHTTTYAYDNIYRRKSITDANSGVTNFTYDAAGNLLTLKDPVNNTTTWGYDNLNRAVSETNQLGFSRSFAYNAAGDLTSKVDRNGRKTTYEYDALRRQTAEKWRDGSDNVLRTISYAFDNSLDLTDVSDPAAAYHYVYDNLGRVTQQTQQIAGLTPTIVLSQVFDAASNRSELSAAVGANNDFKNTYTYDNLDRLTQLIQQGNSGNTVAEKRVDFSYFADGQFNTISRYQSTGTSNAVAQTYHAYDGMGRLTDLDHKQTTTVLAGYDYIYDAASRITSINSTVEGLSTFTYDVTDQLTGADHAAPRVDESYSYNLNGSRTMTGYVTGTNNQTTSDGTFNYEYDNEGNMVKKTTIADGSYEQYSWDYRNRLTTINFKNSSHAVLKTVDHAYDAYNRQVRHTFDSDGPGAAVATDQFFANDGYNPVLEFAGTEAANLSHRYLWSPAVDQILADEQVISLSTAGNTLWPLSDHLGTPRDIADLNEGTGVTSVTNHRTYNSFGVRTAETNSSVDLLFGFTGKAFDEITGLQNNVNRLYDAWLGQWRSEDPIGFDAKDTNLRRYVANQSLNLVDPLGLEPPVIRAAPGDNPLGNDYNDPELVAMRKWLYDVAKANPEYFNDIEGEAYQISDDDVRKAVAILRFKFRMERADQILETVDACLILAAGGKARMAPRRASTPRYVPAYTPSGPKLSPSPKDSPAPATKTKKPPEQAKSNGGLFNRVRAPKYPYNELRIIQKDGSYTILDSYNPKTGEIVSRKMTQLSEIGETCGKAYVREAATKYPPRATILNVPTSGKLAGQQLQGKVYLEVPIQTKAVPQSVLDAATNSKVIIRDVNGKVYND